MCCLYCQTSLQTEWPHAWCYCFPLGTTSSSQRVINPNDGYRGKIPNGKRKGRSLVVAKTPIAATPAIAEHRWCEECEKKTQQLGRERRTFLRESKKKGALATAKHLPGEGCKRRSARATGTRLGETKCKIGAVGDADSHMHKLCKLITILYPECQDMTDCLLHRYVDSRVECLAVTDIFHNAS